MLQVKRLASSPQPSLPANGRRTGAANPRLHPGGGGVFRRKTKQRCWFSRARKKNWLYAREKPSRYRLPLSMFRFRREVRSVRALRHLQKRRATGAVITETILATDRAAADVMCCGVARRRRHYKQKKHAAHIFDAAKNFEFDKIFYLRIFFSVKIFFGAKNFFDVNLDSGENFAIL